jgi:cytochrome P450
LAQYGPIFRTGVFGGTTVFLGSSRAIQMVFNGDTRYTEIGLPATTMAMFGEYSLFQRPDLHRQRKSALRPAFTGTMLAGYLPHLHRVIEQHLQTWNTTSPIALVPLVEQVCFDALVPLLLGIRLDQDETIAVASLPIRSKADLKRLYKTFFDGFYGLVKWRSPLTAFGRGQQARSRLLEFMRSVIQQRRTAPNPLEPTADFLSMMLANQQNDPTGIFSNALIENQCLLQLWASHYEITGLVASWIYQLGQHPEWIEALRAEQSCVLAPLSNLSQVSSEHLRAMTTLEATIKETLRLLPPTSTANRRLTCSIVLDGTLYPKGWTLIAEPRIAHRQAAYFANPDRFDPERFLPPRNEGKMYEFIPFGGGVHACLGAQLAMTMTKVFVIHLLHQFDWTLLGEAQFVQFPLKIIRNNYQIQLKSTIRHHPTSVT